MVNDGCFVATSFLTNIKWNFIQKKLSCNYKWFYRWLHQKQTLTFLVVSWNNQNKQKNKRRKYAMCTKPYKSSQVPQVDTPNKCTFVICFLVLMKLETPFPLLFSVFYHLYKNDLSLDPCFLAISHNFILRSYTTMSRILSTVM